MAGLNDMLADMLRKAIPEEVMALLTKEQIEALGIKINAFVEDIRENFQTIISRQADDYTSIMNELGALREEILNGPRNGGSLGNSNRGGSRGRKSDASGTDSE